MQVRSQRVRQSRAGCDRAREAALALAALFGCSGDDDGLDYARDVQPLFAGRCTTCHHSESQVGIIDIEDAFTQDEPPGLVGGENPWYDPEEPAGIVPFTVVPFDVENSFLMRKITDVELLPGACDRDECNHAGGFMPLMQEPLAPEDIALIRDWISDGALDTPDFRESVAPLFGNPFSTRDPYPCGFCHYPGSPDPPHFTDPFDPVEGIVNVPARFRSDLMLVEPGNPDASFLVMKLEATEYTSDVGAPMPRTYPALSEAEVSVIERWIRGGAKRD